MRILWYNDRMRNIIAASILALGMIVASLIYALTPKAGRYQFVNEEDDYGEIGCCNTRSCRDTVTGLSYDKLTSIDGDKLSQYYVVKDHIHGIILEKKNLDEVKESINEHLFNSPMMNPIMTRNEILLFLEQLKEQK